MNHLKQIAAGLDEYGLDAMLVTSAPGEFYAVGFHGEGAVVVTSGECPLLYRFPLYRGGGKAGCRGPYHHDRPQQEHSGAGKGRGGRAGL